MRFTVVVQKFLNKLQMQFDFKREIVEVESCITGVAVTYQKRLVFFFKMRVQNILILLQGLQLVYNCKNYLNTKKIQK